MDSFQMFPKWKQLSLMEKEKKLSTGNGRIYLKIEAEKFATKEKNAYLCVQKYISSYER